MQFPCNCLPMQQRITTNMNFRKLFAGLALAVALAFSGAAHAQTATRFDAGQAVAVGTNWNTVNTQSVATTATPPANQSVYVTAIYMGACQDATGGASSNVNWTTSGLGTGATLSPQFVLSQASGASTCTAEPGLINFSTPLKGATNTPVVLTSPSAATHTGFASEIFYFIAP